ncbi:MAG: hypothetical protein JST70_09315 [Bacteroidetes bacterium]|nr:hypothetical protein [Bacteroidota bacterium]
MGGKKLITYTTAAFMATVVVFMACKKDNNNNNNTPAVLQDDNFAMNDAMLEQQFEEVESFADQAFDGNAALKGESILGSSCAAITLDTAKKTIVIDFGKNDCLCRDGRTRRGVVNISYTQKYKDSGSVHTIAFSEYFVNNNQVMGSKTITNRGHSIVGQPYVDIEVNGKMVLADNKGTIGTTGSRVRTQVEGAGTAIATDDVFQITGSGVYTNAVGKTYISTVKAPLRKAVSCSWITDGVIEYRYDGITTTISFGKDGNAPCDDQATVATSGASRTITLK